MAEIDNGTQSPKSTSPPPSSLGAFIGDRADLGRPEPSAPYNSARVAAGPPSAEMHSIRQLRRRDGVLATIVGCEHLSPTSAELVRATILSIKPDAVVLELDAARAAALSVPLPGGAASPYGDALPAGVGLPGLSALLYFSMAGAVLSSLTRLYSGASYGGEFLSAAAAARDVGARVVLGDRDARLTLQRASGDIVLADCAALLPTALGGVHLAPGHRPSARLLAGVCWHAARRDWKALADTLGEAVRDSDARNAAFAASPCGRALADFNLRIIAVVRDGRVSPEARSELGHGMQRALAALEESPDVLKETPAAIIDERDRLLCHSIRFCAARESVVAVVGRGHLEGIERYWRAAEEEEESGLEYDRAKARARLQPLLEPPAHFLATQACPPLAATAASLVGGRALFRRSRGAFALVAACSVSGLAAVATISRRIGEVCERIDSALGDKERAM